MVAKTVAAEVETRDVDRPAGAIRRIKAPMTAEAIEPLKTPKRTGASKSLCSHARPPMNRLRMRSNSPFSWIAINFWRLTGDHVAKDRA